MTVASRGVHVLRHAVLGWTAFLSVFLWTSLNRALWRPEIATWAGFGMQGRGHGAWVWVVVAAAALVAFLFYLEGRGHLRYIFHVLLLLIHLPLAAYLAWVVAAMGADAVFRGDTWSWRVPLWILLVPFVGFALASAALVFAERRGRPPSRRAWRDIDAKALVVALGLTPVIAVLFGSGQGFDARARAATALAVVQWLVLISAVQSGRTRSRASAR